MSQEISQDDTFCIHCGETSHSPDNCPFNQEYDGQLETEHHHKIARDLAREEKEEAERELERLRRKIKGN